MLVTIRENQSTLNSKDYRIKRTHESDETETSPIKMHSISSMSSLMVSLIPRKRAKELKSEASGASPLEGRGGIEGEG
jgi:hypothetical protein